MPTEGTAKWPKPKSEDEFEDIVLDALKLRWADPNATRNGRRGQRQNGVDIFGTARHLGGKVVGAQCKNTESPTFQTVVAEVTKAETFKPALAEFLFVVTADRDVELQEQVRLHFGENPAPFPVDVVFWEDLLHEMGGHGELFRRHWPTMATEAHVGRTEGIGAPAAGETGASTSTSGALPRASASRPARRLLSIPGLALDNKRGALFGGANIEPAVEPQHGQIPHLHITGPADGGFTLPDPSCLWLGIRRRFASVQVRGQDRIGFALVGCFPDGEPRCVVYSTDDAFVLPHPWAGAQTHRWEIHPDHANGVWYTFPIDLAKDFGIWAPEEGAIPKLLHAVFWSSLDVAQVTVGDSYEQVTKGCLNPAYWHWSDAPPAPEPWASPPAAPREVTTKEEAEVILTDYGYVPGQDSTRGLPEPARTEVKTACNLLARLRQEEATARAPGKRLEAMKRRGQAERGGAGGAVQPILHDQKTDEVRHAHGNNWTIESNWVSLAEGTVCLWFEVIPGLFDRDESNFYFLATCDNNGSTIRIEEKSVYQNVFALLGGSRPRKYPGGVISFRCANAKGQDCWLWHKDPLGVGWHMVTVTWSKLHREVKLFIDDSHSDTSLPNDHWPKPDSPVCFLGRWPAPYCPASTTFPHRRQLHLPNKQGGLGGRSPTSS